MLIAPSGENKVWTSADAIGAYYWKCKKAYLLGIESKSRFSAHGEIS